MAMARQFHTSVRASVVLAALLSSACGSDAVSSPTAPSGTNGWQKVTLDFKTSAKGDAIIVRLSRAACSEQDQICPIFGTIWYDDFSLQRVGGSGVARGSGVSGQR